jgi:hypothetical protein
MEAKVGSAFFPVDVQQFPQDGVQPVPDTESFPTRGGFRFSGWRIDNTVGIAISVPLPGVDFASLGGSSQTLVLKDDRRGLTATYNLDGFTIDAGPVIPDLDHTLRVLKGLSFQMDRGDQLLRMYRKVRRSAIGFPGAL